MDNLKRLDIAVDNLVREGHDDEKMLDIFMHTLAAVRERLPKEQGGKRVNLHSRSAGTGTAAVGRAKKLTGTLTVKK